MKNILRSDSLKYYNIYFWKRGKNKHLFGTYADYRKTVNISNWLASAYNTEIKEVIQ